MSNPMEPIISYQPGTTNWDQALWHQAILEHLLTYHSEPHWIYSDNITNEEFEQARLLAIEDYNEFIARGIVFV